MSSKRRDGTMLGTAVVTGASSGIGAATARALAAAAFEPYPGGAGYNAAKTAERALTDVLRMELLGRPVRVTEIDPGMVETGFSLVRFGGDEARAKAVYEGVVPLSAEDIAECIAFVATRPSHVDIDRLVVRPRDQARVNLVHRRRPDSPQCCLLSGHKGSPATSPCLTRRTHR